MDMSYKENYTHIYVPQEFAVKYNELDEANAQAEIAKEIIKAKKLDITSELEYLNDDVIQFKAACLSYKAELKKAYDEQGLVIESMVDTAINSMPSIKQHAVKLAEEVKPIKAELESLQETMKDIKSFSSTISFWEVEKLLKLAEQVSNMDEKSKDVLMFLMNNYKRES